MNERSETEQAAIGEPTSYDVATVEAKWQQVWEDLQPFVADDAAVLVAGVSSV